VEEQILGRFMRRQTDEHPAGRSGLVSMAILASNERTSPESDPASMIRSDERTARSASSSCATGAPKT
jgi:hypothetical protein